MATHLGTSTATAGGSALRVFDSLPTSTAPTSPKTASDPPPTSTTNRWGLFFAATYSLPLPTERLLLRTLGAELGLPGALPDPYAVAFRNALLPAWRFRLTAQILARQYRAAVESAVVGVPGLLTYLDARSRWVDGHIASAALDGVAQVLILASGYDTRSLRLASTLPSLRFFEVDDAAAVAKKKTLISGLPAAIVPPSLALPTLVTVDWANPSSLIPALTAAGFDPSQRCVIIAEGLLPHLTQAQVDAVLGDAAALAAPGSRLLWDFLHLDAFSGANKLYTGYSALSKACANKGAPFCSGQAPGFSAWVRATQSLHLRITEILGPQEIASKLVRPMYESVATAEEERTGVCQVRCMASRAAAAPASLPLPQFYSLVSAVKTVPRLSIRDMVAMDSPVSAPRSDEWRPPAAAAAGPTCFFGGLASLLWGRDTEEEEIGSLQPLKAPKPAAPPSLDKTTKAAAAASALDKQRSSDWSLSVAQHTSNGAGPSTWRPQLSQASPQSALQHAESIPAQPPAGRRGDEETPPPPSSWWSWFGQSD